MLNTGSLSRSEEETVAAGRELGRGLSGGEIVLLCGDLGAGKTAYVRGLAEGLEIDPADVSSPTFTLVQEYRGRLRLQHADLYRLNAMEVDDLGLEDLLDPCSVLAVEWGDRWSTPPDAIVVRLTLGSSADEREISIERP